MKFMHLVFWWCFRSHIFVYSLSGHAGQWKRDSSLPHGAARIGDSKVEGIDTGIIFPSLTSGFNTSTLDLPMWYPLTSPILYSVSCCCSETCDWFGTGFDRFASDLGAGEFDEHGSDCLEVVGRQLVTVSGSSGASEVVGRQSATVSGSGSSSTSMWLAPIHSRLSFELSIFFLFFSSSTSKPRSLRVLSTSSFFSSAYLMISPSYQLRCLSTSISSWHHYLDFWSKLFLHLLPLCGILSMGKFSSPPHSQVGGTLLYWGLQYQYSTMYQYYTFIIIT